MKAVALLLLLVAIAVAVDAHSFTFPLVILAAISIGLVLWALADFFGRPAAVTPDLHANLSRVQHNLIELTRKIEALETSVERMPRDLFSMQPTEMADYTAQFATIAKAIEDLREFALLPDAERRLKLQAHRTERKTVLLAEVYSHVAAHDWSSAERLLISLSAEFPNDEEVLRGRHYLDHSRSLFANETITRATAEIEEYLASGQIEKAVEASKNLSAGFPGRGDIQALNARVQREQINYVESTAKRLFDDVKTESDNRRWSIALAHAEKLVRQFPNHRLAESVRPKLETLRENAEIEQRQSLEVQIGELIRDGKFEDAIEMAEDVIKRFPNSPQAESLEKMLPRIQAMAAEQVAGEVHGDEANS